LAFGRLNRVLALAVLMLAAVTLAACGRNGPPLPPPGPVAATPPGSTAAPPGGTASNFGGPGPNTPAAQANAQKSGFDIFSNPVAPPGEKKSFLLDPLLQ
jgi:predicted small lipoprotein YifL